MTVVAPPPTRPTTRRPPRPAEPPAPGFFALFGGTLGLMAAVALAATHHAS